MVALARWDGHTHSRFCPHGSGEATEAFVQRAVDLGFERYSITEHGPLPPGVVPREQAALTNLDAVAIDAYLQDAKALQQQWAGRIDLRVGLEVDYVTGHADRVREFLTRVDPSLDDGLLSVHLLPGRGGLRFLDFSPEDFQEGLVSYWGSVDAVHELYWHTMEEALSADLGPFIPQRLGHLNLIAKFQRVLPPAHPEAHRPRILRVLDQAAQLGISLDANVAGWFIPTCGAPYLPPWILREALRRRIPLVYGSDSHRVRDVGRGFDRLLQQVQEAASELL